MELRGDLTGRGEVDSGERLRAAAHVRDPFSIVRWRAIAELIVRCACAETDGRTAARHIPLVPAGPPRWDGGHHLYFDQEAGPDQPGDHPSMKAGLWVMNLLRTSA